jgi:hypothetical protein
MTEATLKSIELDEAAEIRNKAEKVYLEALEDYIEARIRYYAILARDEE